MFQPVMLIFRWAYPSSHDHFLVKSEMSPIVVSLQMQPFRDEPWYMEKIVMKVNIVFTIFAIWGIYQRCCLNCPYLPSGIVESKNGLDMLGDHVAQLESDSGTAFRRGREVNQNESWTRLCVLCWRHVLWTGIENLTRWCHHPWGSHGNHSWGVEDHDPREAHKSRRCGGRGKLLRVELLRNSSIMALDDAQTLGAAGLLEAEATTTVIYKRNEAEASTKDEVYTLGFFHLNIPSNSTTISSLAFKNCQNLLSVTITESVTHIGDRAFQDCTSLAKVTLGESVTHIGRSAFQGCTSLASIIFGASVTHIAQGAFQGCTLFGEHYVEWVRDSHWTSCLFTLAPLWRRSPWVSLWLTLEIVPFRTAPLWRTSPWVSLWRTLGTLPFKPAPLWRTSLWVSLWLTLGGVRFEECTSLASITLGEPVTHIEDRAFAGCTSLASITLGWFCGAHWELCLSYLQLSGGASLLVNLWLTLEIVPFRTAPLWRTSPWVSLWCTLGTLPFKPAPLWRTSLWASQWSTLGPVPLKGCTSLASVTLGESVTHIEGRAFAGCTSLVSITMAKSSPSIKEDTFHGCTSLANIIVGDSATRIENPADHSQKIRGYSCCPDYGGLVWCLPLSKAPFLDLLLGNWDVILLCSVFDFWSLYFFAFFSPQDSAACSYCSRVFSRQGTYNLRCSGPILNYASSTNHPPNVPPPKKNKALLMGALTIKFPLIRPYETLISGGVRSGGRLTSHDWRGFVKPTVRGAFNSEKWSSLHIPRPWGSCVTSLREVRGPHNTVVFFSHTFCILMLKVWSECFFLHVSLHFGSFLSTQHV